ncbi:MAG: glycosyltransferase [Rhodospirillales bacterium]|nr:glycosyltransferase [Rhodospirillales bacterium]
MLFSIITVTRNNLEGLQKTHRSLIPQTCRDFEWIIIDGASTDGTADYLKNLPEGWVSEPDNGIYDAMNKGITRAQGDYLLFLNAGDQLATVHTLARIREALKSRKPALIYGDALEERPGESPALKPARPHKKAAWGLFTHHQAMLYNRAAIGERRYDLSYKIAADYDFTLRVLKASAGDALYVSLPVCLFEAGGLSQQRTRLARSEQFTIRKATLGLNPVLNSAITGKQIAAQLLKDNAPAFYWRLRTRC